MARIMLHKYSLPLYFLVKAINTACYIANRVFKRPLLNKTSYKLWNNKKPKILYLRVLGCKCFILNTKDNLGKFNSKTDEGIFIGYALTSKAYRVFNKRSLVVEESMHIVFDESNTLDPGKVVFDDFVGTMEGLDLSKDEEGPSDTRKNNLDNLVMSKEEENNQSQQSNDQLTSHLQDTSSSIHDLPKDWHFKKDHPKEQIIGDTTQGVSTGLQLKTLNNLAFISQIEPRNISEALNDENWVLAMQEELNQFERNKVWNLVPRPKHCSIIGSKWVYRNKLDESGTITRNKARLVAKGYNQE